VDPSTDDLCEVTITASDADWLADFVRDLVERRLCAAGHITTSIRSIYRWQGQIYDRPEAVAKLHTRRDRVDEIVRLADERELPPLSRSAGYLAPVGSRVVPDGSG
jgi:Uncharacterized protein involved in tolerance to divalent cations